MMYFINNILTHMFRPIFRVVFLLQEYKCGYLCHHQSIIIMII